MLKIVENGDLVNVQNTKTNKMLFENWYNANDYFVSIESFHPESGQEYAVVQNVGQIWLYSNQGGFIATVITDEKEFKRWQKIDQTVKMLEYDGTEFFNINEGKWNHIALFADPRWNHVSTDPDENKFVRTEEFYNKPNFFCFDYEGNLLFKTRAGTYEDGQNRFDMEHSGGMDFTKRNIVN